MSKPVRVQPPDRSPQAVKPEESAQLEKRVAAILRFAAFEAPTGDINQLLEEIELGRGLGSQTGSP